MYPPTGCLLITFPPSLRRLVVAVTLALYADNPALAVAAARLWFPQPDTYNVTASFVPALCDPTTRESLDEGGWLSVFNYESVVPRVVALRCVLDHSFFVPILSVPYYTIHASAPCDPSHPPTPTNRGPPLSPHRVREPDVNTPVRPIPALAQPMRVLWTADVKCWTVEYGTVLDATQVTSNQLIEPSSLYISSHASLSLPPLPQLDATTWPLAPGVITYYVRQDNRAITNPGTSASATSASASATSTSATAGEGEEEEGPRQTPWTLLRTARVDAEGRVVEVADWAGPAAANPLILAVSTAARPHRLKAVFQPEEASGPSGEGALLSAPFPMLHPRVSVPRPHNFPACKRAITHWVGLGPVETTMPLVVTPAPVVVDWPRPAPVVAGAPLAGAHIPL